MRKNKIYSPLKLVVLLFILIIGSFSTALHIKIYKLVNTFRYSSHFLPSLDFSLFFLSCLIFLCFVVLSYILSKIEYKLVNNQLFASLFKKNLSIFGVSNLLLFSILVVQNYLTFWDAKERLQSLGLITIICVFLIKGIHLLQILGRVEKIKNFFSTTIKTISSKNLIILLMLTSICIYTLVNYSFVKKGLYFSGDEPYYLLTAHSLLFDKDINVANNYQNKDYFYFYPRSKFPNLNLGIYARSGVKGKDKLYPVNLPGLSVLILPFYWLSLNCDFPWRVFIIRESLVIWGVLLGIEIFLLSYYFWRNRNLSLFLWFISSFSMPIIFYSFHVYSEVPVAFFILFCFRKMLNLNSEKEISLLVSGFFLSLVVWFGVKYNLLFFPMLVLGSYSILKTSNPLKKSVFFFIFPLISFSFFMYYLYSIYGTFSPMAIYSGPLTRAEIKELVLKLPIWLRIDSFLDYFFDQRDGLLLYSPIYFFSFLGLIEIIKKSKKIFVFLMIIAFPFIFNYAFFTHRQGYCPQGRVLTPLTWIGVILIAYFFVSNYKKVYKYLFYGAVGWSLLIIIFIINHPQFLYQPTTHENTFRGGALFVWLSNLNIYLPSFLPSFLKIDNRGYLPNYITVLLVIIFIAFYLSKKDINRDLAVHLKYALVLIAALFFILLFSIFPQETLLFPKDVAYPTGAKIRFYSLPSSLKMTSPGEFLIRKANREYYFYFTSWRKLKSLKIIIQDQGDYRYRISLFDEIIYDGESKRLKYNQINYSNPPYYRYKNSHLYLVILQVESEVITNNILCSFKIMPFN